MKKFVRDWLEVIVAVTFLGGICVIWAVADTQRHTEVAVAATAFSPATIDSDRSPASDGTQAGDDVESDDAASEPDAVEAAPPAAQ